MLRWIIGACVVGAGACAAMAVFFGNIKGGLTGAAACIIIMTLAIAVGQYMMYIAIAGGIIVIGTLGVLAYQLFVQRRAISDNVWTQEVAKRNMPVDIREKIYGIGKGKGQAGKIQSATTQKIIKNIKSVWAKHFWRTDPTVYHDVVSNHIVIGFTDENARIIQSKIINFYNTNSFCC